MLKISVQPLLKFKDIQPSIKFLVNQGISISSARHIYRGVAQNLNLSVLEQLCVRLHCTPNDFIFYTPSDKHTLPATHPLLSLNMERYRNDIKEDLKHLDSDELKLVKEHVRTLLEEKKRRDEKG